MTRRRFRVLRDQVLNAFMAQLPTASVWKEDFRLLLSLLADPGAQSLLFGWNPARTRDPSKAAIQPVSGFPDQARN
jgi:hypothetical protein